MNQKEKWILKYIENQPSKSVDMLNIDFVDAYINKFNPPYRCTLYGANKCSELSRRLSTMYKKGLLSRISVGIRGLGIDFPKWVYLYRLVE